MFHKKVLSNLHSQLLASTGQLGQIANIHLNPVTATKSPKYAKSAIMVGEKGIADAEHRNGSNRAFALKGFGGSTTAWTHDG